MKNMIKDALILFVITLVAGVLLGFVYELTKDPRAEQAEKTKSKAYKTVFSDYFSETDDYKDLNMNDIQFVSADISSLENLPESLKNAGYGESVVIVDEAVAAKINDKLLGYAITVTSKEGSGGDI